jgi:transcriptional regulator with PAS, ATPase and Fis domain
MIIPVEKLEGDRIDPFSLLADSDRERLLRAAETDVSILLLGETGTGKGHLARAIAARSPRRALAEINCAALPDELLGSELFGHRRGAYTGAVSDRKGLLAAAAGKTVFLDEIGEISLAMQRMLLRVVQRSNRTIKPLGSDAEIPLPPMRFIFATNRNLEAEAAAGRFREDLLRRIDIVTITVPPLRSRPDVIRGCTARFLEELSALHTIPVVGIEKKALKALVSYAWPGNVRELKNALERALVTAPRDKGVVVRMDDLRLSSGAVTTLAGAKSLVEVEADGLRRALEVSGGSVKRAMEILGIESRSAFYNKMRKHGIGVERLRETRAGRA